MTLIDERDRDVCPDPPEPIDPPDTGSGTGGMGPPDPHGSGGGTNG